MPSVSFLKEPQIVVAVNHHAREKIHELTEENLRLKEKLQEIEREMSLIKEALDKLVKDK